MIEIPRSNTLRMVLQSGLQNFDNTLYANESYINDRNLGIYYQKIMLTDTIIIQFMTDIALANISAYVRNENGSLYQTKTGDIRTVLTGNTFNVYELSYTPNAGTYYLELDFDGTTYVSEPYRAANWTNLIKIAYTVSENDGIIYDTNQEFTINIEGRLTEYIPGQERTAYISFNNQLRNLKAWPIRNVLLEFGSMPRYMIEKILLAFCHETVKVNDIAYQTEEDIDAELIRDTIIVTNRYKGGIQLRQVVYEDYSDFVEQEAVDTFRVEIDVNENLLTIDDSGNNLIYSS